MNPEQENPPTPPAKPEIEPQLLTPEPTSVNPVETPPPSPTASDPAVTVTSDAKQPPKHHPLRWFVLLLVVAGLAAGAAYLLHNRKPAVSGKQDIPLVRYGMLAGASLPAAYPASANTNAASQIESQLFEGLVAYSDQSDIKPLLATGWTNPDNTHWVFTLRQGVRFHSGRLLTPQAVASSLNYAVKHQKDQDGSLAVSLASTIKTVAATGPDKVTITTDGPDPTLLNRLTNLYIFDPQANPGSANAGTGPYVLQSDGSYQKEAIDLKANDSYWGGHVYTRALRFATLPDQATATAQVLAGKYDITGQVTVSQKLKSTPGIKLYSIADLGPYFLGVNTLKASSPLHSLAARQAVASAMDVPAIIKASDTQGQQISQLIPPAIPGYDPSIDITKFDLTKAKQLLATVPNMKTPLTLTYAKSSAGAVNEITRQLTAAGFVIKPQQVDDLDTLVGIALSGKTDLYYLSYTSDTLDGLDILSTLLTDNADYDNPQIDTLVAQASTTLDPSTRIKQLQQISQKAAADLPDIPLYTDTTSYAAPSKYHLTSDIPNALIGAYFWKVYQ